MPGFVRERLHFERPVTPLFATLVLPAVVEGYQEASRAQGGAAGAIELRVVDHHVYTSWSPLDAAGAPEIVFTDAVARWEKESVPEAHALLDDLRALLRPDVPARRATGELDVAARKLARLYALHYEAGQTMRSAASGFCAFLAARGDPAPEHTLEAVLAPTSSLLRDVDAWLAGHGRDMGALVADRPARLDLDAPTWGEDPALPARAKRLAQGAGWLAGQERARERRAQAEAGAMARFAEDERAVVAMLLDALRRGRSAHQTLTFLAGELAVGATRGIALRAGARLGIGADVVWLERAELAAALSGEPLERPAIAARKASFQRALATTPPDTIGEPLSDPRILAMLGHAGRGAGEGGSGNQETADPSSSARLPPPSFHGVGASPGIAVGPVRVIERDEDVDLVEPGDIVVVAALEPTWTPVMQRAAGIVAETGGMLCHAAMVAREMGKPAVVGLPGARQRCRSGVVRMDGARGTVEKQGP